MSAVGALPDGPLTGGVPHGIALRLLFPDHRAAPSEKGRRPLHTPAFAEACRYWKDVSAGAVTPRWPLTDLYHPGRKRMISSRSVPTAVRRQVQLLEALSRERLMDVHFRAAMELVDRARDDLEPSRAVSVYVRLHQVYGQDADRLHQRVLVSLGRRAPTALSFAAANGDDDGIATPRSVLGQIRKRLRGRVNLELREWVEYHTGRTETDLLWAHVENAAEFIEILQPIMAVGEAVELYTASLDVPATRAEIIYYLVLAHRSSASEPVVTAETRAARLTLVRKDSTIRSIRATARRGEVHEISG